MRPGWVRVGFSPEYQECPKASPVFGGAPKAGLFKLGGFGTEIHPSLAQQPGDVQVVKHRVSPFYSTTLEAQLRGRLHAHLLLGCFHPGRGAGHGARCA